SAMYGIGSPRSSVAFRRSAALPSGPEPISHVPDVLTPRRWRSSSALTGNDSDVSADATYSGERHVACGNSVANARYSASVPGAHALKYTRPTGPASASVAATVSKIDVQGSRETLPMRKGCSRLK